jgi:hypothetical protein
MHVDLSRPRTKGVPECVVDPYPRELQQRQHTWAGHSDDNNRREEVVGNMALCMGAVHSRESEEPYREHYGDKGLFWREAYDTVTPGSRLTHLVLPVHTSLQCP